MARDPRSRLTDDGVQPEGPSGVPSEETAEPDPKHNSYDQDWLSMTTADPAFFLKDSGPE